MKKGGKGGSIGLTAGDAGGAKVDGTDQGADESAGCLADVGARGKGRGEEGFMLRGRPWRVGVVGEEREADRWVWVTWASAPRGGAVRLGHGVSC
jgi:hypothetical protein